MANKPKTKTKKPAAPRVEVVPIKQGAIPDQRNINQHTPEGAELHKNSLVRRGANRSIASAGAGVKIPQITAGNQTFLLAQEAGIERIINVYTDGHDLVNVVRTDIKPGSPEAIALGIEDNEIGAKSYNPDLQVLTRLTNTNVFAALKNSDEVFGNLLNDMKIQSASLFAGAAEQEQRQEQKQAADEQRHEEAGGDGIYAFTIPCTKPQRDQIVEILNEVKSSKSFATSTAALIYILERYQNVNPKKARR